MILNAEKYINPFTDFDFKKLFGTEVNAEYEDSLKKYRYLYSVVETAKLEGKIEIAKKAIEMGMSMDDIIKLTGLSEEQIKDLIKKQSNL